MITIRINDYHKVDSHLFVMHINTLLSKGVFMLLPQLSAPRFRRSLLLTSLLIAGSFSAHAADEMLRKPVGKGAYEMAIGQQENALWVATSPEPQNRQGRGSVSPRSGDAGDYADHSQRSETVRGDARQPEPGAVVWQHP
ncbi:Uncharacterised protein [Pluralibacter gergoviae]|nr:Uncharacterised protein [Pluralibacter gergoviae]